MIDDKHDPIIDALLDEVLGGELPPDLTQRILDAHGHAAVPETQAEPTSPPNRGGPAEQSPIFVNRRRSPMTSSEGPSQPRIANRYNGWASAALVLMCAGLFAAWAWQQHRQLQLANQPPAPKAAPLPSPGTTDAIVTEERRDKYDGQEVASAIPAEQGGGVGTGAKKAPNLDIPPLVREETLAHRTIDSPKFLRVAEIAKPSTDAQIVKLINSQLKDDWKRTRVSPTQSIGDKTWFVRANRVLLGRRPTAEELQHYESRRDREEALARLLSCEEFSQHWAKKFADVLVGGATGRYDRESLESYLVESIRSQKPFDQMAFELITAQGDSKAEFENYNPAVNFLLAHHADHHRSTGPSPNVSDATDKVCQVFLGKQLHCARCHDHPVDESVAQTKYWRLASYFTQMQVEPLTNGLTLVDRDYAGSKGQTPDDADLYLQLPNKIGKALYPEYLDGKKISTNSGRVADVNRRVELANSIVASQDFAKATVNRLWRQVFRSGFTNPVDDMGEHNKPNQDKLLSTLSTEFRNSEFDIRSALRWMLTSAAFDRKSRSINDSLTVRNDAFSSYVPSDAIRYPKIGGALTHLAKAHAANRLFDPTLVLGNDGGGEKMSREDVTRALQHIYRRHRDQLLSTSADSFLSKLAKNRNLQEAEIIEHLFYRFIGRRPTDTERKSCQAILRGNHKMDGLIEIGQIILSSEEFKTQH